MGGSLAAFTDDNLVSLIKNECSEPGERIIEALQRIQTMITSNRSGEHCILSAC